MRRRPRVRVRESGSGSGGRRRGGGLRPSADARRRCASRKSGAATDGARDTSQIDVAALHERDRTVTERLHGSGACQGGMRLSTPVSHSGRRPMRRGAARSRIRGRRDPEPGPGAIREPRRAGREGRMWPRRPLVRCEARHETSVRPAPSPVRRPTRERAPGPAALVTPPRPELVGNPPPGRASTAPQPSRAASTAHSQPKVITVRDCSINPGSDRSAPLPGVPARCPQFGPVVDLAYTRWRAPW